MPHQDEKYLHENLQALKALFEQVLPGSLSTSPRHGNATLEASWLAAVAMVCWGFTTTGTLSDRVATACSVTGRVLGGGTSVSRQGLLKALATSGQALVDVIVDHLAVTLPALKGHWTRGGKVNVAVDGSKARAPRTAANQEFFASTRGTQRNGQAYRSGADASKAASVQVLMTVFWHLATGLPLRWRLSGGTGSERISVQEQINQLPGNVRLIGDAEYVGYSLWSTIITSNRSFLFRVGSNITLLKNLGKYRVQDGYVSFWPDYVMKSGQPPLLLRLITLHNGKSTIHLVTNELDMTSELACDLYKQRWGIEVFFRSVKQSCQRSKLHCQTPQNVLSELNWTLLGLWAALFLGKQTLAETGEPIERLSPVKASRAFERTIAAIHLQARNTALLVDLLSHAVIADESHRTSSNQSRHSPRKRKRKPCGAPILKSPSKSQQQAARKLGF